MNESIKEIIDSSNISASDKRRLLKEMARILCDAFGDECACNYKGNDEWLPYVCKYRDTYCPSPGGCKCWEEYILHINEREKYLAAFAKNYGYGYDIPEED